MADAVQETMDAVGLSFFFYSALAAVAEADLDLAADVDVVLTTDAIPSSGSYLFFAVVAAQITSSNSENLMNHSCLLKRQ